MTKEKAAELLKNPQGHHITALKKAVLTISTIQPPPEGTPEKPIRETP